MTNLSPQLANKLAKVCGLFGSHHDGEVLAAARMAHRIIREAGATWPEALTPTLPAPEPQRQARDDWRTALRFCLDNFDLLDERDGGFIRSIHSYRHMPSAPQLKWLADCCRKLMARGCRA
jgi:hypothetical protein